MKLRFDIKGFAVNTWSKLRQLRDAPHAVAGGVAIGIFWGFTPLTGLKTLLSIFFAWVFRCSKIPAVIAVTFHDVLLPIWPVILLWEYKVGFWILSNPHQLPPHLIRNRLHLEQIFRWKTLELLWPTFLGSCVIGLPIALVVYWIVERSLERYEKRRHLQLKPPA